MWTLPVEASFYLVLPLIAAFGLLHRWTLLALAVAAVTGYFLASAYGLQWDQQGGYLFSQVPLFSALKSASFFLIGACFWGFRDRISLSSGAAACSVMLLIIAPAGFAKAPVLFLCLPYLIFYCGLALPGKLHLGKGIGDLSYGAYLYAFPVQQSVVASTGADIGPTWLTLIATPITLLLAFASWWLVEKPFLRTRRRMARYEEKVAA
ncbi:acyltransferase family protein [Pseudoroseomonas wenyumeiae]